MMTLLPETVELVRLAVLSGTLVFTSMVLLHAVSDFVHRLLSGDE